ncbi:GIY-YIG nuclease family protein [Ferrovibrio xuzhouensis]|uniref:GIY-YIG nuclease family protein n=1 Tax=Ferrovibrio xuzhouensis TaxID=1576914 RepID=A0ABV7VFD7_9PROT
MARLPPKEIIAGAHGPSEKIRRLARHGYTRTEIAKIVDKRYQHVRKVLIDAGITTGLDPTRKPTRKVDLETEPLELTVKAKHRRVRPFPAKRLSEAGFHYGGDWQIDGDSISISTKASKEMGVYAIVLDGFVVYVGVSVNLWRRMVDYWVGHQKQKTSQRVKDLIRDALLSDRRVSMMFATPGKTEWSGLPVDLSPGLESALIEMIQPDWNVKGSRAQ